MVFATALNLPQLVSVRDGYLLQQRLPDVGLPAAAEGLPHEGLVVVADLLHVQVELGVHVRLHRAVAVGDGDHAGHVLKWKYSKIDFYVASKKERRKFGSFSWKGIRSPSFLGAGRRFER